MIAKKNNRADLERKRFAFFQIGLVVAGSLTLAAFEYTSVSVEKKKVTIVEEAPMWTFKEDMLDENILDSKPQPQQTSLQTEPVDEVTISTNPLDKTGKFTPIIIDDPCDDCEEKIEIVDDTPDSGILLVSDVDPAFPGGYNAMMSFIQNTLVVPQIMIEMGAGGLVNVEFVVNTDGTISHVKCANQAHPALMKEAERVVAAMPNWIPGENAGKKVRVRYTIPINVVVK